MPNQMNESMKDFSFIDPEIESNEFSSVIVKAYRKLVCQNPSLGFLLEFSVADLSSLHKLAHSDWAIESTYSRLEIAPSANDIEVVSLCWMTVNNTNEFNATSGSPLHADYRMSWIKTPLGTIDQDYDPEEWDSLEEFATAACKLLIEIAIGDQVLTRKQEHRSEVECVPVDQLLIEPGFTILGDTINLRFGLINS